MQIEARLQFDAGQSSNREVDLRDNNIIVNLTNSSNIDISYGEVTFQSGGGKKAGAVTFRYVAAKGGFDSKILELEDAAENIRSDFALLNGERMQLDTKISRDLFRVVDIHIYN